MRTKRKAQTDTKGRGAVVEMVVEAVVVAMVMIIDR